MQKQIKTFKASPARPKAKTYKGVTPAAVLEFREFVGCTVAQTASYFSVSESTVKRYCRQAAQ
jgi:DNA-binding transcriptional regulator YiaG